MDRKTSIKHLKNRIKTAITMISSIEYSIQNIEFTYPGKPLPKPEIAQIAHISEKLNRLEKALK